MANWENDKILTMDVRDGEYWEVLDIPVETLAMDMESITIIPMLSRKHVDILREILDNVVDKGEMKVMIKVKRIGKY